MKRITKGNTNFYAAYIKNNLTGTKIIFPVMPNNISENINANFTQQDIVGASAPRIVYTSTAAKTISLSLQNLTEDYIAPNFKSLISYVRALQALTYPIYSSSGVVSSPNMTLVLGNRSMSVVCTNVSVSWGNNVKEQQILSCNIDLSFLRTRDDVPGATTIMNKE